MSKPRTGIRSDDNSEIYDKRPGNKQQPRMTSRMGSLVYPTGEGFGINQNKPKRLLSQSQKQMISPDAVDLQAVAAKRLRSKGK